MKRLLTSLLMVTSVNLLASDYTVISPVKGYTPTQQGTLAQFSTLVIKDGKVVKYGNEDLVASYPKAKRIDGQSRPLLPGLIDAHGHIIGLGNNLNQLDLRGTRSIAEVGEKLKAFAEQNPDAAWLIGRGWNQENWQEACFGTAKELDKYVADRPVMLERVDGHAIWVNSKAMALSGVTAASKSPAGGEIIREDGAPSGVFIDKAESLIRTYLPKVDKQHINHALNRAGAHLLALGITSTHDAGIDKLTWQTFKERAQSNTLPLRVYGMLAATDPALDEMLAAGPVRDSQDFLSIRSVKVYADGALGSRGAALLYDYADRKGHQGLMLENQDALEAIISKSIKHGFAVNTHAIGDRANRIVLDAYETVFKRHGGSALRNRIEHAQIVHPEDIPRFKALKIIPSMQPVHATSDMHMAEERLHDKQLEGAYAWQTFLQQGSKVAAGSDFPVELANVFHGLYSAITRMDHQGTPPEGWLPEERLTREQALRAFTLDAAYSANQEFKIGSLEQGKWADFVLLDKDYFTVPVADIKDIQVVETWIAGEQRYAR